MGAIDELYDLSDQDRVVLANEVKSLESADAAFEEYQSKLSSLLQHKSKAFKIEQEKQFEARVQEELEKRMANTEVVEASDSEVVVEAASESTVEEIVENVEVPHSSMANNNEASSTEESLTEKFKKAFNTESISITY